LILTAFDACEPVLRREIAKARTSWLKKYLNCIEKNRCKEEKFNYRKTFCTRIYAEGLSFAKAMLDRIEANDFIPNRFLFKQDGGIDCT